MIYFSNKKRDPQPTIINDNVQNIYHPKGIVTSKNQLTYNLNKKMIFHIFNPGGRKKWYVTLERHLVLSYQSH